MNKNHCCDGAIFDLDGVITQTAKVHFKAWKQMFDTYLQKRKGLSGDQRRPFSYDQDYVPYVDGKPRYQGVKSFLESRDISIPFGKPGDPPTRASVCGLGNRKNELFRELVSAEGVEVYLSTILFIKQLKQRGVKVAVASSSMNCQFILEKTGLEGLFEEIVGGTVSRELDLKGKPEPDIFLVAADNMEVDPGSCILVEDAISGVEAGRRGNFALVIGIARGGDAQVLKSYGADLVVRDMKELTFKDIERWFARGLERDNWMLVYHGFEPERERLRESLTSVGNGYFGTRGCFEANRADDVVHYPGTYIAGVYNTLPSIVYRKTITNNDLVNCPNWLLVEVAIENGRFRSPLDFELLDYRHDLDMRSALVSRRLSFKDKRGRITSIESERLASMADPHLAALRFTVRAENWSGRITLRSALDGTVINYGVPRYRELNSRHLTPISVGESDGAINLEVQTVSSKVRIYLQARHNLLRDGKQVKGERRIDHDVGFISEQMSFTADQGQRYTLEKIVSLYTSKDRDVTDPHGASRSSLARKPAFSELRDAHEQAWRSLWDRADMRVEGDRFAQQALRLHIYHLLCTASPHNRSIDAGMPARGLHGEAYRGHIFWDELFIYPFYNLHFPEIARALLLYRYRRLEGAREYAHEHGYRGAMYPWQTADNGHEETQVIHFNPVSGKWDPDLSSRQRHVSIAVAYSVWEYFYCTGDLEFLNEYGAEILVLTTRFWSSIAEYEKSDNRYHIRGVMGPDEFHEKNPGADAENGGLNDNAYTNILVGWLMHKTIETLEYLPKKDMRILVEKTGFKPAEMELWKDIVSKMNVVISKERIISQFDGYMDLKELDWEAYRSKYGNIGRLDRILKAEGDSPDRYRLSKQADVLMTYYLLSPGQVKHILELMGYSVGDELELMRRNYEYYSQRTSHGSTLSYIVHAGVLKYLKGHRQDMWRWFHSALKSDVEDIQGGTTEEGIHTGVMGGTIDLVMKTFAGISLFKDMILFEPQLPSHWRRLSFKMSHRRNWFQLSLSPAELTVKKLVESKKQPVDILVGKRRYSLKEKESVTIPLPPN
ncbi:MAG: beta-phosphoglucomutase family hydrolase [Spirochaetaceae bacterium]|nr:MAG: beta-phosphoglucomutase family hydrolase [Spirochaetaceae bacterium]